MVLYVGYDLGYPDLEESPLVNIKKRIIDMLDNIDEALKFLKSSVWQTDKQWVIISTLYRANQGCPRIYMLFIQYAKTVKRLDRYNRQDLWPIMEHSITDPEKKLFCGERQRLEVIFGFVLAVCAVMAVGMGFYCMANFFGDKPLGVLFGVSLTWVILVGLIWVLWQRFEGFINKNKFVHDDCL